MKKSRKRLTTTMLFLSVLTLSITSCNDQSNSEEAEAYYSSMNVSYYDGGSYLGTYTLPEDSNDKFTSISKADFTLSVYESGQDEAKATLTDYTVTKNNDTSFDLSFKSPFDYKETLNYILESNKTVTEKGYNVKAIIYVSAPEPELDIQYSGAYKGSDKITLTASLSDGYKFASDLNAGMLIFPDGLDLSVSASKESDTKAIFTISNIPAEFSGTNIDFTLKKEAIDSVFAKDVYLNIDFKQFEVEIDKSSISYDESKSELTVGKVILPNTAKGKENGLSMSSIICKFTEQKYDASSNTYSYKIAFDDSYSDVTKDLDKQQYIYTLNIHATLIVDNEEFTYTFSPSSVLSGIKSKVNTDEDKGTLSIELIPYNASFKEGTAASDITVTGSDELPNFKCTSIAKDKIVYTADYTSALTNGVALSFSCNGSILETNFGLETYSIMTYIPAYLGDRESLLDWSVVEDKLVESAAKSLGSLICTSVANFVLPYIYDFLDVDTSNPELNAISDKITQLSYAINDLSNDVNNLSGDIENATNKSILDNFQTLETTLLSGTLSLLKNEDVISYVSYLKNALGGAGQKIIDNEYGRLTFEKFKTYYFEAHGGKDKACRKTDDKIETIYNGSVNYARLGYFDEFVELFPEFTTFKTSDKANHCRVLEPAKVLEIVKGAKNYHVNLDLQMPEIERNMGFEKAFDKLNYNNSYVSNVVNLGSRILSNASGTSSGIIDLFFNVVDTKYNFESQTITIKKSFVSKLQSIYFMSAAMAIQYCDSVGDTGNSSLIRSNVKEASIKFEQAFNKISEMESTSKKGNDRILISNQLVNKELQATKVSDFVKDASSTEFFDNIYKKTVDAYYVSIDTIRSMISRAQKRKISLATDLKQAGFKNVVAASGNKFVYLSNSTKWGDAHASAKGFGYGITQKLYTIKADIVVQDGTANSEAHRNYELLSCTLIAQMYQQARYDCKLNGGYNVTLGFKAPAK